MIIVERKANHRCRLIFGIFDQTLVVKITTVKPPTLAFLLSLIMVNAGNATEPSIIPLPQQVSVEEGSFRIDASSRVCLSSENPGLKSAAKYFARLIRQSSGIELTIDRCSNEDPVSAVMLVLADRGLGDEGYELVVKKSGILITAKTSQGIFYGLQSVRQLLPPPVESSELVAGLKLRFPLVQIKDRPSYAWRGLMLDESRHFFGKA